MLGLLVLGALFISKRNLMVTSLLYGYFLRLPLFLVWIAGVAIALKHHRQHPEVSRPVLLVLIVLLIANAVDLYLSPQLAVFARGQGWGPEGFGLLLLIKGLILIMVNSDCLGACSQGSLALGRDNNTAGERSLDVLEEGDGVLFGPLNVVVLSYLFGLPLVLVWFIGAWKILKQRARHPQVGRPLLIALGMLLVTYHVNLVLNLTLPGYLAGLGLPTEQTVFILRLEQGVFSTITALAWGLTIWAAFGWRGDVSNHSNVSEQTGSGHP